MTEPSPLSVQEMNRLIRKSYKYVNMFTPLVIRYGMISDHVYELSTGREAGGMKMYGVTIVDKYGEKTEYNKCENSLIKAEAYIGSLRARLEKEREESQYEAQF